MFSLCKSISLYPVLQIKKSNQITNRFSVSCQTKVSSNIYVLIHQEIGLTMNFNVYGDVFRNDSRFFTNLTQTII